MAKVNTYLYLKKGFNFPKSNISINTRYEGKELRILNPETAVNFPNIDFGIIKIPFGNGGGHSTELRWLWMEYGNVGGDVIKIFNDTYYITGFLSLLVGKYYFETSSMDIYTINAGGIISGCKFNYPLLYEGIQIYSPNKRKTEIEIVVPNSDVNNLMTRISFLSNDDLQYFKSATYLIREAKKKFFKGEDSGALTDAVSSVEALYLRKNATNGHFDTRDPRFGILNTESKQSAFEFLFRGAGGSQALLDSFHPRNIYGIRSGHLHSGQIDFHVLPHPRNDNDPILDIILICQKIIISALYALGA